MTKKASLLSLLAILIICIVLGCSKESGQDNILPQITDRWESRSGKYADNPIIIRTNSGLREIAGHKALQHRVAVSVPIKEPTENGLPGYKEEEQLTQIENALTSEFTQNGSTVFASIITNDGTREYIFYTGNPKAIKRAFKRIKEKTDTHPLELDIQRDKKWIIYKWFSSWQ